MDQSDTVNDILSIDHYDLGFVVQFSYLYLEHHLVGSHHILNNGSV